MHFQEDSGLKSLKYFQTNRKINASKIQSRSWLNCVGTFKGFLVIFLTAFKGHSMTVQMCLELEMHSWFSRFSEGFFGTKCLVSKTIFGALASKVLFLMIVAVADDITKARTTIIFTFTYFTKLFLVSLFSDLFLLRKCRNFLRRKVFTSNSRNLSRISDLWPSFSRESATFRRK